MDWFGRQFSEDYGMKITARKWLWAGLGAMVLLSLLWDGFSRQQHSAGRWNMVPLAGLGFVSRDMPLNGTEKQVYRQAETVKRAYQAGAQHFILTAVDGSRNRHAVHNPLYCFRGDGWQVIREQTLPVPGGQAKSLSLARNGRRTEAIFWFTNGQERHCSAWRAWWLSQLYRLTLGKFGGEPALVLLQPGNAEAPNWSSIFSKCPFLLEL
jgi:hypothetical protein